MRNIGVGLLNKMYIVCKLLKSVTFLWQWTDMSLIHKKMSNILGFVDKVFGYKHLKSVAL